MIEKRDYVPRIDGNFWVKTNCRQCGKPFEAWALSQCRYECDECLQDAIFVDLDGNEPDPEPEADFSAIRILYFILIAAAGFALIFGAVCVFFLLRGGL